MTPKTLAKERREKFEAIIRKWIDDNPVCVWRDGSYDILDDQINTLVSALVEASESRTEKVRGVVAAMYQDRPVEASDLLGVEEEALKAFERDMQCPGSWSWYPAKSTDDPAWKALREFVVSLYQKDNKAFEKYYTWARDPYARGAKLPIHIRQDPTCFEYAWQAYQAANPSAEVPQLKTDENGVPETY